MITRFDAFYGGHVEMDDLGFDGPPAHARRAPDRKLATTYEEAEAFAELMDRTGYDTLWLAEHHFQREGYGGIPNIPLLALHLAHITDRLNFGAFFNTVTAWHPLRLAEDYATVDILTGGRVRFGIGRGYIAREVESLGAPLRDDAANRDLFEEQVAIILTAWNEPSFRHRGAHYRLPPEIAHGLRPLRDLTLVPRPQHGPLDVWQPIASATPRGFDFMARHGIKGVIAGGIAPEGRADEVARLYREGLARAGRETALGQDLAIGFQMHLADSRAKALEEAAPWYEEQLKALAPLGRFPHLSAEQVRATANGARARSAGLPTIEDADADGVWVCGPPELIRDKILELQERFPGMERLFVQTGSLGVPPSAMRANLEWFAQEIRPALAAASAAPT